MLLGGTGLRRVVLAAVLMAAGLMTKHMLVALPVAATLALLIGDRRGFAQWTMAGIALGVVAIGVCLVAFGPDFVSAILDHARRITVDRAWQKAMDGYCRCRPS